MAEREYAVIVKKGVNLEEVDADLAASTGDGPIPNRSVDIANPRKGSRRMTHWMLTHEEAEALKLDERILAVEIPPDQRDDIKIGLRSTQSGNFVRGFSNANDVNWGLRRCIEETNVYANSTTISGNYDYVLDGNGIDVVIQDSGIEPNHPEWEDPNGNSRLQQIDWYTESGLSGTQSVNHYRDRDGHGTHVAGIAVGKTYGWAKQATIYSQKLSGLETLSGSDGTGISISDAFDAIRLWHLDKVNERPTVVNMSWGYFTTATGNPTGGAYRGTPWLFTTQTDTQLWSSYGIVSADGFGNRSIPAQVASVDAEIDDMVAAGIHVVIAAGNDSYKSDLSTGADYNNYVTYSGLGNLFYHRPGSPYSVDAFYVGALDTSVTLSGGSNYIDTAATFSRKGPAVDMWAPGVSIMSATSTEADASYTTYSYPPDNNYDIMSIPGTSMAAPQVAGLIALYLKARPDLNPEQVKNKLINDSKSVLYTTGLTEDYNDTTSLLGSPNRHLYSRYGVVNPYTTNGAITLENSGLELIKEARILDSNAWLDDSVNPVTVSSIVSSVAIQVTASIASPPPTPFAIIGQSSGASTNVTSISANTGTILELNVNNSNGFIQGEALDIIL